MPTEPINTPSPAHAIKLYQYPLSGHCHRVQLFLALLGIPHELILVDLKNAEQKSAEFLAMNRFGQVPVIDDAGLLLADSNAILVYLAGRYGNGTWLPKDPVGAAATQRWLSVAAGPLANGPATLRAAKVFKRTIDEKEVAARSGALLAVMDAELEQRAYLTGDRPTIADLAMYTYTAHAPEGGLSLEPYRKTCVWLARIESLPGFVPMARSAVGLFAE
jgi:glutathione S-transferase